MLGSLAFRDGLDLYAAGSAVSLISDKYEAGLAGRMLSFEVLLTLGRAGKGRIIGDVETVSLPDWLLNGGAE